MKKGRFYRIFALLLSMVLLGSKTGLTLSVSAKSLAENHSLYQDRSALSEDEENNVSLYLDRKELEGFAAMPGEGLLTTTGGDGGEVVIVENTVELVNAINDDIPRIVVIKGQVVSMLSNDKMDLNSATNLENNMGVKSKGGYGLSVGSNKTIVGYDENAELYGGLKINNESNVIVSNLKFHGVWPYKGPGDTIEVAGSHHVWLNHLSVWNSEDGNLDIKTGADYITVSWSKFWYEDVVCEWDTTDGTQSNREYKAGDTAYAKDHGHRLSGLIGSGAGNHDDTDMDKLHVTYHHNWFADYVNERMPRVMYGRAHVYNNYYTCSGNLYCVSVDSFGSVLVENNYFKNVKNPHQFSYLENKAIGACITARGNEYDNTSGTKATGQKNSREVPVFEKTVYDYYLNTAAEVPEVVTKYAGIQAKGTSNPKKGTLVKGTTEAEKGDTSKELAAIAPANTPANDKKKISYDATSKTYTYNGQNPDGSNGFYTIANPFAGKNFTETPVLEDGYPAWTKGVTIAYWVKLPASSGSVKDAAVLNFNLENDRQLYNIDSVHYERCSAYDASDADYSMGTKKKYIDAEGRIYTVLENYGSLAQYNPNYPIAGYYYTTKNGGAYHVYEQGKDPSAASNWTYLNYIGRGYYADYAYLYDEDTVYGAYSKCREALVSGSFSLYASGSMGYRQDCDDDNTLQRNPNLASYGNYTPIHKLNQFYYWANGSTYTCSSGEKSPIMADTGADWHYVVTVITNDWVQTYIDGTELTTDYLNYWGKTFRMQNSAEGFNLGYGHKGYYRTKTPSLDFSGDTTLLDFISGENTTLCIGGLGAGAKYVGQDSIQTPEGTQIKGLEFYDIPLSSGQISATKVTLPSDYKEAALKTKDTSKQKAAVIPDSELDAPITEPEKKPDDDEIKKGDVDGNGSITAEDALCILKNVVGLMEFDETQTAVADTDGSGSITAEDALLVLKYVVGLVEGL